MTTRTGQRLLADAYAKVRRVDPDEKDVGKMRRTLRDARDAVRAAESALRAERR